MALTPFVVRGVQNPMRALLLSMVVLVATCLAELFSPPANAEGLDAGAISAPEFPLQVPAALIRPRSYRRSTVCV